VTAPPSNILKYVILGGQPPHIVIATKDIQHCEMVAPDRRATCAGFCTLENGLVHVWGNSIGLSKSSHKQDAKLIACRFGLVPAPTIPHYTKTVGEVLTLCEWWVEQKKQSSDEPLSNQNVSLLKAALDYCQGQAMRGKLKEYADKLGVTYVSQKKE